MDENLPLPKHLATLWEEIYAKLILEQCFSSHFVNLDFEKEKPDLRNEKMNIGIEVTSSMDEKERALDSIYPRDYTYGNPEEKQKAAQTINHLGGKICQGFLIHPTKDNNLTSTFSIIKTKLEKLNNEDFQKFKENDLFIFGTTFIQKNKFDVLRQGIETLNNHFDWKNTFNNFYIFCLPDNTLVHYSTKTKNIKEFAIENTTELSEHARKIVLF